MELVWSSLAKEQLRNVLSYVEEEYGDRIAHKTLLNISQKISQLLSYPERGIIDAKLSSSFSDNDVIRHILVLPNVIYYVTKNDSIIIIAIAHTKQSPSTIRKMFRTFFQQNKK